MRITWLLERCDALWGGVKVALEDANWLADRGHEVTVLSRSGPPGWMALRCAFRQVPDFAPARLPVADVVIGTFWTTVPYAAGGAAAGRGAAVHFCQGYEGDNPENAAVRAQIEAVYRLPDVHHVTIAPHLSALLRERFGASAREIVYAIDHEVHRPGPPREPGHTVRVGLVGPYQVPWKDIATGIEACRLAAAAGLDLRLVRITNTAPDPRELDLPFPVEWHERVEPARMGGLYRSLDVFLGTSSGPQEGFFLPAVEAMACGVPCVLTDIPCFRSHGDEQYALWVPPRDPALMAEALVVAGRAPQVRSSLREAGLRTAARYTQAAHGRALEEALLAIAAPARADSAAAEPMGPARASESAEQLAARLLDSLQQAARELEARGDHAGAGPFRNAARALRPADGLLASAAAWARHLAGDTGGAVREIEDLLRGGLDDAALHERHGHLLHAQGRAGDAAQAFRAAIAAGARSADSYNLLGVVLYESGDLAGARSSFERALALDPVHADARTNLADLPVG